MIELASFGIATVVAITVICYGLGVIAKRIPKFTDEDIPALCISVGAILGVVGYFLHIPDFPATDLLTAIAVGMASGAAATGVNQALKQKNKKKS